MGDKVVKANNKTIIYIGDKDRTNDIEEYKMKNDNYVDVKFVGYDKIYSYLKNNVKFKNNYTFNYKDFLNYYAEIARVKDRNNDFVEDYLGSQLNDIAIEENDLLDIYFSKKCNEIKVDNNRQIIFPFGINLSQRAAVANALHNKVSIIQGPPGTGKTQSILNIIANLMLQNKTVAVVSGNNEAIKNVLEKMQKRNYDFALALLGNKENKVYFFQNQKDYPDEMIGWLKTEVEMNQLLLDINEHEKNLMSLLDSNNRKAILTQQLFEYQHEYKYFREYFQSQDIQKLKRLSFFQLNSDKLLKLLIDVNPNIVNLNNIFIKIKNFFKYGIYDFQQYKNIESIILELQNQYYKEKITEIEKEIFDIDKLLKSKDYKKELALLEEKSRDYFQSFLANKYEKKGRKKFSIDNYFEKTNFHEFIEEYPVVLASAHSIAKSKDADYKFDYLIVDEASQVDLIPGIIALHAAKNAVIVGDLKQLPHIPEENISIKKYDELRKKYNISLEYDYYHNSLLSSCDSIFTDDIKVMLKEHYRCDNRIIEFCNRKYYGGKLVCLSDRNNVNPLVLLKTVPGNHLRYGKNAVNKITNIRELESLMDKEFIEEAGIDVHTNATFGFMAPFRGQVNAAEGILQSEFQKDTVHKFQGRECDIILFSSVLDAKFTSKKLMGFVDEPHLINVAVSRAIDKFVLVSHVDVFLQEKHELCDLIRYMQYYQDNSIVCESKVRSIFDLLYSDYSKELKELEKRNTWGRSKYISENLTYALLDDILDTYKYKYVREVRLKDIFRDLENFTDEEITYIKNNARLDIAIYNVYDKQLTLAIEVDGFTSHENNPSQLLKDKLKNSIFEKAGIPLLRLSTVGSNEKEKIEKFL